MSHRVEQWVRERRISLGMMIALNLQRQCWNSREGWPWPVSWSWPWMMPEGVAKAKRRAMASEAVCEGETG